jgi:hypothetical protein
VTFALMIPLRITQITRHKIYDSIALARVSWSGRLEEPDFLGRIYDLAAMKSTDTWPT